MEKLSHPGGQDSGYSVDGIVSVVDCSVTAVVCSLVDNVVTIEVVVGSAVVEVEDEAENNGKHGSCKI